MTDQTLATPVPLGPALTEQQAREIYRQGEEAVVFALLTLAQKLAEPPALAAPGVTPTTPSAMIPPYLKPKADGPSQTPRAQGRTSRLAAADARAQSTRPIIASNPVPTVTGR